MEMVMDGRTPEINVGVGWNPTMWMSRRQGVDLANLIGSFPAITVRTLCLGGQIR